MYLFYYVRCAKCALHNQSL